MNLDFSREKRKGQSAIEYLTTYGWALLAIVIVGALLMNTGVFSSCTSSNGFTTGGNAVQATDVQLTGDGNLLFNVRNSGQNTIVLEEVNVSTDSGFNSAPINGTLSTGQTTDTSKSVSVPGATGCTTVDVTLQYTDQALGQSISTSASITQSAG